MKRGLHLPTEAKRRLRSAAHRAALRFEHEESLQLLTALRDLVRSGANEDAIEGFVSAAEAASVGVEGESRGGLQGPDMNGASHDAHVSRA